MGDRGIRLLGRLRSSNYLKMPDSNPLDLPNRLQVAEWTLKATAGLFLSLPTSRWHGGSIQIAFKCYPG